MILVIYNHVCGYMLGMTTDTNTPMLIICQAMRMPMFFFVSGFIAYKSIEYWTLKNTASRLFLKSKVQLIPTFVFWTIYYLFVCEINFPDGFWFTLVLFEVFLIYYSISFICNSNIRLHKLQLPLLFIIALLLIVFRGNFSGLPIYTTCSIGELITYFGFFVFGITVRKYWTNISKVLEKGWVIFLLMIFSVLLFYMVRFTTIHISSTATRYILGLPLIVIFFNYFYSKRQYWDSDSIPSRVLQFIGRRTLDIYLIHNFFLVPSIGFLFPYFSGENNEALVLLVAGSLTIATLALSLLVSSILRSSSFLARWLFGAKE